MDWNWIYIVVGIIAIIVLPGWIEKGVKAIIYEATKEALTDFYGHEGKDVKDLLDKVK